MIKTLYNLNESVTLDHPMWWEEAKNSFGIKAEVYETIDGGVVVFEKPINGGEKMTLTSREGQRQRGDTISSLNDLFSDSEEIITVVDMNDDEYDVRLAWENGGMVFVKQVNILNFDWYLGTINLALLDSLGA